MNYLQDPRVIILGLLALVWVYRAWRSIRTLQVAPIIEPVSLSVRAGSSRPNVQNQIQGAGTAPLLSIIIPAKNEETNIGACLDGLLAQKEVEYEIIVANDNSEDRTEEVLKSYGEKITYFNVSKTPEGWTGKNYALHEAVQKRMEKCIFSWMQTPGMIREAWPLRFPTPKKMNSSF